MKVIYWPRDEFDCTPASRKIAHDSMEHQHFQTEEAAAKAFLTHKRDYDKLYEAGRRYWCICGPGGLVRDVKR